MKAALMYGPNDIRVEEIDKPVCPEDGLLINVRAVGLCGSDIRNLTTDSRKGKYPHVYGHEVVGQVTEIGPKVEGYAIGDKLYVYPVGHCGRCEACRSGHSEMCQYGDDYTGRMGGFTDYYVVTGQQLSRDSVFKLNPGQDEIAATLAEPLSSVYACQDNIDVRFGDTVVVIGAGPIGCFHVQLARMRGATKIAMVELNEKRLEMAQRFGADLYINSSKEDPVEAIRKWTNGRGADKVISATPVTATQNQAIYMTKNNGITVWFGGVAKGKLAEIDSNYVHYHGLWIYGHFGANSIQVEQSFHLALSDAFQADKFITHVLPLSEINKGIHLTKTGEAIKVVLIPNEELNKDLLSRKVKEE
ncbi:zinc-binding dehydrogenase [Catenisphaera adipataccumulans]|jgi:L-iditol 2-dehydrogenase|uniref:L-iditol 2-dehydrogenase n=1 Tax=Catenisphaera adipataccumulans TaxID=700500 RepID=A0A7W8D0I7_9FIRM|nr:alcohol dehydrogenase catalytic domain-containing protein [Catenisphaera adipataccumulans]MBB5183320.1 L-iditol 2-dehydrogenase [Catenisphaera adipataccumulans]